jgi:predicted RNA polymerase sigma factor
MPGRQEKNRILLNSDSGSAAHLCTSRAKPQITVLERRHQSQAPVRADLLRRLGHTQHSRAAYDRAIELTGNTAETAYPPSRDQLR